MPVRHHVVVLNGAAGTLAGLDCADVAARIEAAFSSAGHTARVVVSAPDRLDADIRAAAADSAADVVVIGGGDGTVSRAAGRLDPLGKAMGVLPLGTLNLFARDLGIPVDLDAALAALATAELRKVDLGEVGGHVFLSNATFGIYPRMVRARERRRRRTGVSKWPAMIWAALRTLRRPRTLTLQVEPDSEPMVVRTALFMVANNRVADTLGPYLTRETVDGGELALYIARPRTALGLVKVALAAIAGRVNDNPDLIAEGGARTVVVNGRKPAYPVALDGEVVDLAPPMTFRLRARSLAVLCPKTNEDSRTG
jgi:diacylglycerol kinase family enzyme